LTTDLEMDPKLICVVDAWPTLPADIQTAIVAIVKANPPLKS
jgi:hypothetical protein